LSTAVTDEDLAARKDDWPGPKPPQYVSGAIWKFAKLAGLGRWGAVTHPGAREERHDDIDQWARLRRLCAQAVRFRGRECINGAAKASNGAY